MAIYLVGSPAVLLAQMNYPGVAILYLIFLAFLFLLDLIVVRNVLGLLFAVIISEPELHRTLFRLLASELIGVLRWVLICLTSRDGG